MATEKPSGTEHGVYFLARDWQSSARLSLQHYVIHARLGYLLHPTIEASLKDKPTPRILDLATGTGIWAVEASLKYPQATVVGLDLADNQFPPAGTLPSNVTFGTYNFFEPVPEDLAGTFDIVHVSLINAALYKGGRDTVLQNIHQFLKPGGHVQWLEVLNDEDILLDPSHSLQPSAQKMKAFAFVEKHAGFMTAQGWTREFPKYLREEGGFVDAKMVLTPQMNALLSQETLLVLWNVLESMTKLAEIVGTEEATKEAEEVIEDVQRRVKEGKVITFNTVVGVAKRPE